MVLRFSFLLVRLLDGIVKLLSRLSRLLKPSPETKQTQEWDLIDGREPGWHRLGEHGPMIASRSRTWNSESDDAESPHRPEPDTSRSVRARYLFHKFSNERAIT
jgi:hypothetical protein